MSVGRGAYDRGRKLAIGLAVSGLVTGVAAPVSAQGLLPGAGWSGLYWGGHASHVWADVKKAGQASDLTNGVTWGAQLGYGLQFGGLYIGAEVDGDYGGASTSYYLSPLYSSTLKVDWTASARLRAGVDVAGALVYVTGGRAWSGQSLAVHTLGSQIANSSKLIGGNVIGAGVELKVLPGISARIEALHYDFNSQSNSFLTALPATIAKSTWQGLDTNETVVRLGVNIRTN